MVERAWQVPSYFGGRDGRARVGGRGVAVPSVVALGATLAVELSAVRLRITRTLRTIFLGAASQAPPTTFGGTVEGVAFLPVLTVAGFFQASKESVSQAQRRM